MSNHSSYPDSQTEALTLLYLQKQDLSGLTPEQFMDRYYDAKKRISSYQPSVTASAAT